MSRRPSPRRASRSRVDGGAEAGGSDPVRADGTGARPATTRRTAQVARAGARRLTGSVRSLFEAGGPGFRDLALTHAASTAADTLVTLALASTLFFAVPSTEARGNVVLYLVLTLAPFALIGPLLGRLLDRAPIATRGALQAAAIGRAILPLLVVGQLDSFWLFPAAFGLLVLSRVHTITRNALLPLALDDPTALVAANARLAWIGVLAGGAVAPFGGLAALLLGPGAIMVLAATAAATAALLARRLPEPDAPSRRQPTLAGTVPLHLPRRVRVAQIATAAVRALHGFLLFLLAFALRDAEGGVLDLGAVLGAAGIGYGIASLTTPWLERRLREEPMVVAALAVEAGAAFSAGQWFGLPAAIALAAAAGFAWGTAKLSFDGLLQRHVPASRRGAAFTRSETVFSIAWVLGAIVPTGLPLAIGAGLPLAGFAALAAQIVYVGVLLSPTDPTRTPRPDVPPPPPTHAARRPRRPPT